MANELKGSDLEKLNYLLADVFPNVNNQVAIFAQLPFKLRKKYLKFSVVAILAILL